METTKIITIDGPCGAGKTTVAKQLAERLCGAYLDTGAIFRAMAFCVEWHDLKEKLDFAEAGGDMAAIDRIAEEVAGKVELEHGKDGRQRMRVDGCDVANELRRNEISELSSRIAVYAPFRDEAARIERLAVKSCRASCIVAEGRDMGTAVFPDACAKFFLTADVWTRAERRYKDSPDSFESLEDAKRQLSERDERDAGREIAPLSKADDAAEIDSTDMTVRGVVREMLHEIESRTGWTKAGKAPQWADGSFSGHAGKLLRLSDKVSLFAWRLSPGGNDCCAYVILDGSILRRKKYKMPDGKAQDAVLERIRDDMAGFMESAAKALGKAAKMV